MDSSQIWYRWKGIFEENPTPYVTKDEDYSLWKTSAITEIAPSDHSRDIGSYHIRTSTSWTFPLLPRTFSFSLAPIWMRCRSIWGRNMTFTSRNARVWVLLWWNGLVGLSFICKRLLIVESLDIIGCDSRFFLNTLCMHVCTL